MWTKLCLWQWRSHRYTPWYWYTVHTIICWPPFSWSCRTWNIQINIKNICVIQIYIVIMIQTVLLTRVIWFYLEKKRIGNHDGSPEWQIYILWNLYLILSTLRYRWYTCTYFLFLNFKLFKLTSSIFLHQKPFFVQFLDMIYALQILWE